MIGAKYESCCNQHFRPVASNLITNRDEICCSPLAGSPEQTDGAPVAYATSDGVVEPRWGHLIDYTYDGSRQRGQLSQGLGQLVDGVKGPDNFSNNNGFEWVGWKSMNGDVVIEFTFRTLRNFTGALFHSNNLFSSGVEVFQAVDVHFGIDVPLSTDALKDALYEQQRRNALSRAARQSGPVGEQANQQGTLWSPDVISIEYEPDKKHESSRPVTIHLKQRLANKLKFVLKFASKWILLSEVEFLSHPVELLSFSSFQDLHARPLASALASAKSYDQYVAILREHQLRRLATNAYLESFASSSAAPSFVDQGSATSEPASGADVSDYSSPPRRINGPSNNALWQQQQPPVEQPASNPIFGQLPSMIGSPAPAPPSPPMLMDTQMNQELDQQQQPDLSDARSAQEPSGRKLGTATALSLVLVSILLLVALLLGLSSYRFKHAAKMAGQLEPQAKLGSGTLPFMNVFDQQTSSTNASSSHNNHYNPLFAPSIAAAKTVGREAQPKTLESIRRGLATLTGNQQQARVQNQQGYMHSLPAHQLLVSLKDQQASGQPANRQQQISTQLIVGLNQANPMAQQQIYNSINCSNLNGGLYSMSVASSSTNGGQQMCDYGEYAIPDASQPIIGAGGPHLNQAFQRPFNHPYQTELRPQRNLMQAQKPAEQHNYEFIYQDSSPLEAQSMYHQRSLSGQQQHCNQPARPLNTMTLAGRPRLLMSQESPNGSQSSQTSSGIATSLGSSLAQRPNNNEQAHQYYYATNGSERDNNSK